MSSKYSGTPRLGQLARRIEKSKQAQRNAHRLGAYTVHDSMTIPRSTGRRGRRCARWAREYLTYACDLSYAYFKHFRT